MEAIAALGLACNVMQLISFSRDVLTVVRHAYATGTVQADLGDRASRLSGLAMAVDDSLGSSAKPQTPAEKDLQEAARKSHAASLELHEEINKLNGPPGQSRSVVRAVVTTVKTMRRKSRIDKLEETMLHWQKVMDSGLLLRIW